MKLHEEVQKFLGKTWTGFQQSFADSLRSEIPLLDKANRYILKHEGKKLRPTFSLLIAQALRGGCNEQVLRCAVASELLHTATLIHDDVADDSPTRHGVPTTASIYSAGTAVLVGDFWLSRAMDMIIDHPDKRVLHIFSKCLKDLAEGEMLQLERAQKADTDEEKYREIIYRKTASLFESAIISSAYSSGAGEQETAACRDYAFHVGMAFQMMDDILDYSPELSTGKPSGQDILEKKITIPLLVLFERAPKSVVREIRRRIRKPDETLVSDAFRLVRQYDCIAYAREKLDVEIRAAKQALASFQESRAKSYLEKLADMMTVRTA